MNTIHVTEPGGQSANYPEQQARSLWAEGRISPQAYCWKQGMPDWRPAPEFFQTLGRDAGVPPLLAGPITGGPRGFAKDPAGLTRFLKVLLWISLGLAFVSGAVGIVLLIVGRAPTTEDTLTASEWIEALVALAQVMVYIATAIPFLMWIHRANRNARHLGAETMTFTPAWSVGWYFIPILNLWKPYQAMKQIWQASQDPANWTQQTVPAVVGYWWGLWLLASFLGQLSFRLAMKEGEGFARAGEILDLVVSIVDITLCLVALRLISAIYRMQSEWAQRPQQSPTRVLT